MRLRDHPADVRHGVELLALGRHAIIDYGRLHGGDDGIAFALVGLARLYPAEARAIRALVPKVPEVPA